MIMIGGGALLLIGVNVGTTLFAVKAMTPEPVVAEALPAEPVPEEVFYYNVQPEFVVNFKGKTRMKFLMIEMVVATHDDGVLPILSDHDPELRNSLLMLLAEQNSDDLKTAEGKQALRDQALLRITELVDKHYKPESVEDVFITRLVMQ